MRKILFFAMWLSATPLLWAQQPWNLRTCIGYALQHNISIKQKEVALQQREIDFNTSKWSRLPNLNGNVGQAFNFGRALQPDNTYANHNTRSSQFSLGTTIPLFTGMEIPNTIALNKLNLKAAVEDLEKARQDISLQVTQFYLQAIYSQELLTIAHQQVQLSKHQLQQKQSLFDNGKASESDVFEAMSRVAQDESSAVQADNDYNLAILDLTQLLELPTPEGFSIESPRIDTLSALDLINPEAVYAEAVQSKPSIKAANYRLQGAEKSIRIARSAYYPQISFGAGIGTNYYHVQGIDSQNFSDQWTNNMNKYLQFSMSIPIFNRFSTRNRIRTAKLERNTLAWNLEESKKALFKEIQQAYYNAVASGSKLRSSQAAVQAAEATFHLTESKYENGLANATEYNEMRTQWMKALSNQLQAKYDYLFRIKILDFYRGREL